MRPRLLVLFVAVAAVVSACSRPADPAPRQNPTPSRWTFAALPATAVAGATFDATLTLATDPGWKVYSLTQPAGGPAGGPKALVISVPDGQAVVAAGPAAGPKPYVSFDPNFGFDTEVYQDAATITVPLRASMTADLVATPPHISIRFQTCNDRMCMPAREIELRPGESGPTAGPSGSSGSDPVVGGGTANVPDLAAASRASTIGAYIALAAAMGALSLLTPCVFPMVPITVSYFTNRSGRTRRDAIAEAVVYGLGIVLTFTAVGFVLAVVFGASGLNRFAADPWLNLGVTALFVAFALSLFGVWEIALPSSVVNAAARADQGRGRFAGTLLMGLAFTLTSFTCTAPFLGTLLVVAAQGDWQWPLAGMLAFSSVFAAPFVALALAPHWLKSLPKSGSWLLAVKAAMGMAELAAAMKFLSNVDLVWGWGVFTREVVLITWIVISLILVGYLAGMFKLGHAPRLGRPAIGRFLATTATFLLAAWLATGLTGRRLGELEAFLPPADLSARSPEGELAWILNDYEAALAEGARANMPVLIDFTGYTCTNCRWMEANMFTRPDVERELSRFVRVRLYTDGRDEIHRRYQQMEQDMFGTVALPFYVILGADGVPKVSFGGLTRDPAEFISFLRYSLE
jgi:thiol:disulfide interchange protein DsbD